MADYSEDTGIPTHSVLLVLLIGVGLLLYIAFIQWTPVGWDPVAYLYAAAQIADGHGPVLCHPLNAVSGPYFTMSGFNVPTHDPACLRLNFPVGFPALLALGMKLAGRYGAFCVVPLMGVLGLASTAGLARRIDGWRVALLAALLTALAPVYLQFSTVVWSDVPSAALGIGGIYLFVLSLESPRVRSQSLLGFASGMLIGAATLMRYANATLFAVPLLYAVVAGKKRRSAALVGYGVASLSMAACIALLNIRYYGGPLRTPYGPELGWYPWSAFSPAYSFGKSPVGACSLCAVVKTLWANFGVLLGFAILGAVRLRPHHRVAVVTPVLLVCILYGLYAFPAEGINARFLLPAVPFLSIAVAHGLRRPPRLLNGRAWRAVVVVLLLAMALRTLTLEAADLARRNMRSRQFVESVVNCASVAGSDAIILAYVANDALFYYGEKTTMFYRRMLDHQTSGGFQEALITSVSGFLERGVPVYYVVDTAPPYMDLLDVLQEHFVLTSLCDGLHRVSLP